MTYIKAKWFAHKHQLNFYYRPFRESAIFALHSRDKQFNPEIHTSEKQLKKISHLGQKLPGDIHYSVLFHAYDPLWEDAFEVAFWEELMNDIAFLDDLRESFKPALNFKVPTPPKAKLSVALHIRQGGGFDGPLFSVKYFDRSKLDVKNDILVTKRYGRDRDRFRHNRLTQESDYPPRKFVDSRYPYKFIPEQYYVDQLNLIAKKYPHRQIYAHVFTDDRDPKQICERMKKHLNNPSIELDCHVSTRGKGCLIYDIKAMTKYEILIRSRSHFGQLAQLAGNFKLVIAPKTCAWNGNALCVKTILCKNQESI